MTISTLVSRMEDLLAVNPKPVLTEQDIARSTTVRPQGNALAYIYRTLAVMGQLNAALVASAGPGSDVMRWKGFIAAAGDFPAAGAAEDGWVYYVTVGGVTDPVTAQTFNAQDLIIWNGVNWSVVAGQTITNPVIFKGSITVNTDFPLLADVESGWLYRVLADVTDNAGPPRTNTGQSFKAGDEIVWNGLDWTNLGPASFAASAVTYDNSGSDIVATNVQDALTELATDFPQYASSVVAYVDPNHPKAADDGDVRTPFLTIMGAMPASPPATQYMILIAPGVYPENVVVNYSRVQLKGSCWSNTIIEPGAGDALTYRPVSAVVGPWDNRVQDLVVRGDVVVSSETAPASGIFYPSMCGNELMFVDCGIYGNMTFDRCNFLSAQGAYVNGNVSFTQCSGQWWNFTEVSGTVTLNWAAAAANPPLDNTNYGWSPYDGVVTNLLVQTEGKVVAKQLTVSDTLTLATAQSQATLYGCPVATVVKDPGATLNNIGDYYDNDTSGLAADDVQAALDELATGSGGVLSEVFADTSEPTGFPNTNQDSTTSLGSGPGPVSFQIQPTGASYDYWIKGVKYNKTGADSVTVGTGNIEGFYVLYFDGATLTVAAPGGAPSFISLLKDYAYVGAVYWDSTNNIPLYYADERHGLMPWETHYNIHKGDGTRYLSGLAMSNFLVDQSGALITHAQFAIGGGDILDEDLTNSLLARAVGNSIPLFYKTGAAGNWRATVKANGVPTSPLGLGGSSRAQFNEFTGGVWTQTEVGNNNDFLLAHILATNDPRTGKQFVAIQGQAEYQSITTARAGAATEVNNLVLAGLTFAEFIFIGTIIYQTSAAYGNVEKARVRSTDTGADYVDFRDKKIAASGSAADHGNLGGLLDDDHPQYVTVDGRITGQTNAGTPTLVVASLPLPASQTMHLKVQAAAVDNAGVNFSVEEIWTFVGGAPPALLGVKTTVHSQQTAAAYTLAISAAGAGGNVDISVTQGASANTTDWKVNIESAIIAP